MHGSWSGQLHVDLYLEHFISLRSPVLTSLLHTLSLQRTGNPDVELTAEEIQKAIDKANTQTLEAIERK